MLIVVGLPEGRVAFPMSRELGSCLAVSVLWVGLRGRDVTSGSYNYWKTMMTVELVVGPWPVHSCNTALLRSRTRAASQMLRVGMNNDICRMNCAGCKDSTR